MRDGSAPWEPLSISSTNVYDIEVTDAYGVAVVCRGIRDYNTVISYALASEGKHDVSCVVYDDIPATVPVTGQMMQAGQVTLYDSSSATTAPWTFSLDVPHGTHDLFAFTSDRVLIQRDITIDTTTTLPEIDVTAGSQYELLPVTITGKQLDETTLTSLGIFTENSFAVVDLPGSAIKVVPDTLLQPPFDMQFVSAAVTTQNTHRRVEVDLDAIAPDGPLVALELMPRLDGITLANTGVTWTSLPPGNNSLLYLVYADDGSNVLTVRATAHWASRHTSLPAELDVEGYLDAWRVPVESSRKFTVSAPGYRASTSVTATN